MLEKIQQFLSTEIANEINKELTCHKQLQEIRIRTDKPLILQIDKTEVLLNYVPTKSNVKETIERISQYSFYAFEQELSLGYITLPGGHRVGVCGQAVVENNIVKSWRHISGLNIRIAHSIVGCGNSVIPFIYCKETNNCHNTMIISPPGYGKTTLLRDIIRQLSTDKKLTIGLADERSEVAGSFNGVPQNDVGIRTDVIDGCPKALAMVMLLRGMSPKVIAVDELGGEDDTNAVDAVINAGVKLICTVHGKDLEDAMANPTLKPILSRNVFEKFIVLNAPSKIAGVYDRNGKCENYVS